MVGALTVLSKDKLSGSKRDVVLIADIARCKVRQIAWDSEHLSGQIALPDLTAPCLTLGRVCYANELHVAQDFWFGQLCPISREQ